MIFTHIVTYCDNCYYYLELQYCLLEPTETALMREERKHLLLSPPRSPGTSGFMFTLK